MRIRKKQIKNLLYDKTLYCPTPEHYHAVQIFAAFGNLPIRVLVLNAGNKHIVNLVPSDLSGARKDALGKTTNPVGGCVDVDLHEQLKRFEGIPPSRVLEKCLLLEIDERIKMWGCSHPAEFITLVNSSNPLGLYSPKFSLDLNTKKNYEAIAA
jgi:hypothetical protein